MEKSTTQQDLGILLTEALREIRELRTQMNDIHALFRPVATKKTRKQLYDDKIERRIAEEMVHMMRMT